MSRYYSDRSREKDKYALPDVEVFHVAAGEWTVCSDCSERAGSAATECPLCEGSVEACKEGWYYWYCFPGCMPEGEPIGPFGTEMTAVVEMRKNAA